MINFKYLWLSILTAFISSTFGALSVYLFFGAEVTSVIIAILTTMVLYLIYSVYRIHRAYNKIGGKK
jgi:membrane protein implicated in regulation of membrane protease activity